ncbi:MAG: dCTP deaminase [SAR324 cluster bacterium]|nr:dCTP deaminase [SAR324 cluster bacterium]MCH2266925.1 dCTP deaminase [SAR324 cluster bacterium]
MIIPDIGIKKLVKEGYLPAGLTIGPSSVDLTLSDSFSWPEPDKDKIILGESVPHKQVRTDEFVLEPNHFVLASTAESIRVPHDMAAYVEGRSSIGRLGLQVQNAGFIDAGFHGQITLELENQSGFSIVLKKGVRICQIVFVQMSQPAEQPYSGKYSGQSGATPSRLEVDPEFS